MNKHISRFLALLLLFLNIVKSSNGQSNVSVKAKIDAQQITVGDQARVFIEATIFNKDLVVKWAKIPDTINQLEFVEKGKIDTLKEDAHITYKQRLLVTGFDSGRFVIPAFHFVVNQPGGIIDSLSTDSFFLDISTLAVDTTKAIKPIKSILEIKTSWLDYIGIIIGSLVVITAISALTYYIIKKCKNKVPLLANLNPSETLEEKTLKELKALENEELWQKDKVKLYYSKLTEIIRVYLEERYKIATLEQTTDEILIQLKRNSTISKHYQILRLLFEISDLAKFAKATPLPQEHIQCMEIAVEFVTAYQNKTSENTTES